MVTTEKKNLLDGFSELSLSYSRDLCFSIEFKNCCLVGITFNQGELCGIADP